MKKKLFFLFSLTFSIHVNAQNVGINTTNPQTTLDVKGNYRIGGNVQYMSFDSLSGKMGWTNTYLFVPVTQALMKHSAAADGLFYNNSGGINGQLEYRNEFGNPVFYTNFTNGKGYFKGRLGISTITPLAGLHVADSSVLFSATGNVPATPGSTPILGAGRRMMWFPDKAAFRAGYVIGDHWDTYNVGNYSFASGSNTNASGSSSSAMGAGSIASGIASTSFGSETIANGDYSTAMGFGTNASGFLSIAMGSYAIASGQNSTALGNTAIASGDYSLAMGQNINARSINETVLGRWNTDYTPSGANTDRLFSIGNGTSSSLKSEAMTVLKNGNVGIGMSVPSHKLHLFNGSSGGVPFSSVFTPLVVENNGHTYISLLSPETSETAILFGKPSGAASGVIMYNNQFNQNGFQFRANGNITRMELYANGNAWLQGTLTQSSDSRLKKDINPLQNSLQKITQLNGYSYYWKNENSDKSLQTGVLAQEVRQLFPELVKEDKEGMLSVNYSGLIPVLIESIKEQQKQMEILVLADKEKRIQIDELKKLVEKLLKQY